MKEINIYYREMELIPLIGRYREMLEEELQQKLIGVFFFETCVTFRYDQEQDLHYALTRLGKYCTLQ